MARRTVDPSMLQGLVQQAQHQEVQKGSPRTTDKNFPVFSTPVNTDILVYIPRTNVISTENAEEMQVLNAVIHDARIGKQFTSLRCINGLQGPGFDALGYDGTCPACEGTADVWDLYRMKLNAEAKKLGIDPQNDVNDTLKPVRERILSEMDLKGGEEYVTFPIVIIPTKGKFQPADDALENLEVVFVHWRKSRYEKSILGALDSLMTNPGHPAGMFWLWKFSYDTKGKQPNARDSAKEAKYTPITDGEALTLFEKFRQPAEEKAAPFTLVKAAEVVVANQFLYKEDIEVEVNKILAKTRNLLELANVGGGQPALGAGQPAGALGVGNPLANFGTVDASAQPNLGEAQPNGGQPQGTPIKFG